MVPGESLDGPVTTYRAVVKYAIDATPKERVAALRDGLGEIATELVEEHGLSLEDVTAALERARDEAELAAEYQVGHEHRAGDA